MLNKEDTTIITMEGKGQTFLLIVIHDNSFNFIGYGSGEVKANVADVLRKRLEERHKLGVSRTPTHAQFNESVRENGVIACER